MGLINGTVILENKYNIWKTMFEDEKDNLIKIFNQDTFQIEHVGSTAVKGLSAKPIVDIAIGVASFSDIDKYMNVLETIYTVKISNEEILLIKENQEETFFLIHILIINNKRYNDMIKFRDILINNSNVLKEYEQLKIELSKKYSNDRKMYTKSKNNYIHEILENINS